MPCASTGPAVQIDWPCGADCFDSGNVNFMFNQLPYVFGSGCCFITGALLLPIFACIDSIRSQL